MPWYDWRADCCGCEAYTINTVDDRDNPPEACCTCGKTRKGDGKWVREISGKVSVAKGDTWGGGKGNW